jgi:DNA-directed RNA polymerase alpha subunit
MFTGMNADILECIYILKNVGKSDRVVDSGELVCDILSKRLNRLDKKNLEMALLFDGKSNFRHDLVVEQEVNLTGEEPILHCSIDELGLRNRARNALVEEDIWCIGQLVQMSDQALWRVPNFGRLCLEDVERSLSNYNLSLRTRLPDDWKPKPG